ncbi:MAG: prepilin-type N-terminal cleavage/methylation domain-containing protein [Polaromonas sp.]|nr:prepilin-type N-terminal cleavage/methylation domain-containing protein [Polaromonas sp.]
MKIRNSIGSRKQAGFTLVEMSVVLVVVGLLFGAVVKGQEVVDFAKSQKLINDIKGTEMMIQNFAQTKSRLPGDCDADGIIDFPADASVSRIDADNGARSLQYDFTTTQVSYAVNTAAVALATDGCAQEAGIAATSTTADLIGANTWINDLKLAGLVSDVVPNRTFAKQVNEDFLFVGNVTDANKTASSAAAAQYNAIIVQNVPQWMARQVAVAINGTDAVSDRSRVRQLVATGTDGEYELTWDLFDGTAGMRDQMVSLAYYFDRVPSTGENSVVVAAQ